MDEHFPKESIRKFYIERYPDLDNEQVELVLLRSALLRHNDLFNREAKLVGKDGIEDFKKRWHADPINRLSLPLPPATFCSGNYKRCAIVVEIDLRYSDAEILRVVKHIVHRERDYMGDALPSLLHRDNLLRESKPGTADIHPEEKWRCLYVYEQRQKGKTWSEIQDDLELDSPEMAHNYYDQACELISKGIATLPQFPTAGKGGIN